MLVVLLLFVVAPLVELYIIIEVGSVIGAGWTIALIVASSVCGYLLAKHEGIGVWRRFLEETRARRVPTRDLVDAVLIFLGGVLMFVPGFITSALGLALLIPPIRVLVRGVVLRRTRLRYVAGSNRPAAAPADPGRPIWVENTADRRPERDRPELEPRDRNAD